LTSLEHGHSHSFPRFFSKRAFRDFVKSADRNLCCCTAFAFSQTTFLEFFYTSVFELDANSKEAFVGRTRAFLRFFCGLGPGVCILLIHFFIDLFCTSILQLDAVGNNEFVRSARAVLGSFFACGWAFALDQTTFF